MKLQYDEPLSNFAFNFNLRRYKPAALDATLHLAGTCRAAESEAKSNTMVLRIPAAIAAFAATGAPTRPPMRAAALCGPDANHSGPGAVPISGDFVLQGRAIWHCLFRCKKT